jgi:hypothetical protein
MNASIQRNVLAAAVAIALTAPVAKAQIFNETFNIGSVPPPGCNTGEFPGGAGTYPFPATWTLFNVDNRTPATNVSYVNAAWEVREDFANDVTQCAAFSTSWYSPAGAADDWMWTPAIALPAASILSWRAIAYDPSYRDGYEVRVKTGAAPDLGNQLTSTVVFTTPAEQTAWTAHTLDLTTYGGQTVYLGFRNNSNDKFLLLVDDVKVQDNTPDLNAVTDVPFNTDYSIAPAGFEVTPTLAVTASNAGGIALTNIVATATPMLDGSPTVPAVVSTPIASLAIGAIAPAVFGPAAPYSTPGVWRTSYSLTADQTEPNTTNNVVEVAGTTIGGDELARHEGDPVGTVGIGAGNGGEIGVQVTLATPMTFGGMRFGLAPIPPTFEEPPGTPHPSICPGFDFVANLRSFDTGTMMPGAIIASTVPIPCEYDVGGIFEAEFATGAQTLAPGTYVLTVVEPTDGATGPTLTVFLHAQRFVIGTTWVNWPTTPFGGWANLEDFGAGFQRAPSVSLVTETPIFQDGFDVIIPLNAPAQARTWRGPAPKMGATLPTRKPASKQLAPRDR